MLHPATKGVRASTIANEQVGGGDRGQPLRLSVPNGPHERSRSIEQSRERLAQLLAIPHQVATPRSVLID
jgi:hypothetical protein